MDRAEEGVVPRLERLDHEGHAPAAKELVPTARRTRSIRSILVGLTMTLYSAIYLLLPTLTNGAKLYSQKLANLHFWSHLLGGIGMGAFMGMAGLQGMLRRTIYVDGQFEPYMILAALSGALLLAGLAAFLVNIVMTVGIEGAVGIFRRGEGSTKDLVPAGT